MTDDCNRILLGALTLLLGLGAAPAMAECRHNGEAVEEGTRVGGFLCEDGEWVEPEPED